MTVNILAVGDVCGSNGLEFLRAHLRSVKKNIAFTVVNGENANVVGITLDRQITYSPPERM